MKRLRMLMAVILACMMTLTLAISAVAATESVDDDTVDTSVGSELYADWESIGASYQEAVVRMSNTKDGVWVMRGTADDDGALSFNPQGKFTRAQLASILAIVDIAGNPNNLDLNELFAADLGRTIYTDVGKDHWAAGAINYASRQGLIGGIGTGKFNPDAEVTSDMMMSMVLGLLGFSYSERSGTEWISKCHQLYRENRFAFMDYVYNYDITREEVASAFASALKEDYYKRNAFGEYAPTGTALWTWIVTKTVGATIELEARVISNKYASLFNVPGYLNRIVLQDKDGTIYQIEDCEDAIVPVAYLGRFVKLKVKATKDRDVYTAVSRAEPLFSNDLIEVDIDAYRAVDYTSGNFVNNVGAQAKTDAAVYTSFAPGKYLNYSIAAALDSASTSNGFVSNLTMSVAAWQEQANRVTDMYAVRNYNRSTFGAVFFNQRMALKVGSVKDSVVTFTDLEDNVLDDLDPVKADTFEYGTTLKAGDVVVAVVNKGRVVTVDKVAVIKGALTASKGDKVVIGGKTYGVWGDRLTGSQATLSDLLLDGNVGVETTYWIWKDKIFYFSGTQTTSTRDTYCVILDGEDKGKNIIILTDEGRILTPRTVEAAWVNKTTDDGGGDIGFMGGLQRFNGASLLMATEGKYAQGVADVAKPAYLYTVGATTDQYVYRYELNSRGELTLWEITYVNTSVNTVEDDSDTGGSRGYVNKGATIVTDGVASDPTGVSTDTSLLGVSNNALWFVTSDLSSVSLNERDWHVYKGRAMGLSRDAGLVTDVGGVICYGLIETGDNLPEPSTSANFLALVTGTGNKTIGGRSHMTVDVFNLSSGQNETITLAQGQGLSGVILATGASSGTIVNFTKIDGTYWAMQSKPSMSDPAPDGWATGYVAGWTDYELLFLDCNVLSGYLTLNSGHLPLSFARDLTVVNNTSGPRLVTNLKANSPLLQDVMQFDIYGDPIVNTRDKALQVRFILNADWEIKTIIVDVMDIPIDLP